MRLMPVSAPTLPGWTLETVATAGDGFRRATYREDALAVPAGPALRVRVADALTLAPVADLTDGGTYDLTGRGIIVDPDVSFAALRFAVDNRDINRIEANPPLAVFGDTGGHLNACPLAAGVHVLQVSAYATIADAQAFRSPVASRTIGFTVAGAVPMPTPPPVVVVGPTPMPGVQIRAGQPLQFAASTAYALERGGQWDATNFLLPDGLTLTAFGETTKPPPVVRATTGQSCFYVNNRHGVTLDSLALVGSHAAPALRFFNGGRHVVQYCDISGGTFGITAEGTPGQHVDGLTIRGCLIHDNYNGVPGRDSSGVFAEMTVGLVIDRNVFDCNGWNAATGAGQTVRNHHLYHHATSGPAVVTNNVFARPSAHGAQVRAGGTVSGNLFFDCPIALDFGVVGGGGPPCPGGVSGAVRGNVFCGHRDTGDQQRGPAIEIGNVRSAVFDGNLIAHGFRAYSPIMLEACKPDPGLTWDSQCVGILDLTISNNKLWDWPTAPPTLGLGYGAHVGGAGNLGVAPLKQSSNVWAAGTKAPDLRAMLGDPVKRVMAGEKIETLLAACFAAAEQIK